MCVSAALGVRTAHGFTVCDVAACLADLWTFISLFMHTKSETMSVAKVSFDVDAVKTA